MKRILLIGASKHIGYHIIEELAPQKSEYDLFVIARTPADRITQFKGKENVTFIQGDAKDTQTVSNVVNSTMGGDVDFVIITVGGTIVYNKFLMPRISDPTLCGTVANTVVNVLKPLPKQPILVALSSTGILSTRDLLPWALKPLYRAILHKPHLDKIVMENTISNEYPSDKWVLVRGALYMDGDKKGTYRVGEKEVGYTIRRRDVADFVIKQCINGEGKWLGKRPVVVY